MKKDSLFPVIMQTKPMTHETTFFFIGSVSCRDEASGIVVACSYVLDIQQY